MPVRTRPGFAGSLSRSTHFSSRALLLALVIAALAWRTGLLLPAAALGALPMLLLAVALAAQPPAPRSLKKVGWGLVASSLLLGVALAVGAHL